MLISVICMLGVQLQVNHESFTKRTRNSVLLVNNEWFICNCTTNMPITNTNRERVLITAILQYWLHCNQYSSGIWRHNNVISTRVLITAFPWFLFCWIYVTFCHIWRQMHQFTDVTVGFDLIKTNILVRQTPLSSRLTSNRHVGRTVTDKSLVIHQKN